MAKPKGVVMPWIAKVVEKYSPDGKLISKEFYACPTPSGKCKPCNSFKAALAEAFRLTELEKPPLINNQDQDQDGGMKM